jgi:methylated-DNA-[protein]-cysteine S-methyltransferase
MPTPVLTQHRVHTVVDSPVGPLTLVTADGAITGLYLDQQRHAPSAGILGEFVIGPSAPGEANEAGLGTDADPAEAAFAAPIRQLREYFAGQRTEFDLPLALDGTPFQRRVWAALVQIPYGQTISYGELAQEIGQPTAARAVGLANGRNPVSIIVPCHRVVGATGDLTGYGGGLARKQYLLAFEQRVIAARQRSASS